MIEASRKLNFVTQDSQNVTLPSEYSSWHNRHETKIFLISVVGVIAISLYFGIKESLSSNLQISSEILVLALVILAAVVIWDLFIYLMECFDRLSDS